MVTAWPVACRRTSSAPVPRIVLMDNAAMHKGDVVESKRRKWARQALHLYYLPPYSRN
ncbi:transposase [Massilia mucilaginosa]|uniref:transposase n=1 Tax=Massilia mucilaginosa TaxID=2609282 RepID=UPI00351D4225